MVKWQSKGWSAFSSKQHFIKMPFHRSGNSSNLHINVPFIEGSFHQKGAFSSFAPFTESTIGIYSASGAFQIWSQNCSSTSRNWDIDVQSFRSSKLGAVLRAGQAGGFLVFSLAYLALSLPWLMELLLQPQLQTNSYFRGLQQGPSLEKPENLKRSYLCF
jgi:hypothetical protein